MKGYLPTKLVVVVVIFIFLIVIGFILSAAFVELDVPFISLFGPIITWVVILIIGALIAVKSL